MFNRVHESADLERGFTKRLTLLHRQELDEIFFPLLQLVAPVEKNLRALRRRYTRPALKRGFSGIYCPLDVSFRPDRNAIHNFTIRGITNLRSRPLGSVALFSSDNQFGHNLRCRYNDALRLQVVLESLGTVFPSNAAEFDPAKRHFVVANMQ